jgi:hypothetical protein
MPLDRPALLNTNLAAQGALYRQNMTPPTSVMDPRWQAYAQAQNQADALMALSAFPGPGELATAGKAALTLLKGKGALELGGLGALGSIVPKPQYGITHRPPMRESGAPLHDLTGGGNVYPDDIYGKSAAQFYGHFGGNDPLDVQTVRMFQSYKGNPDAPVTIYRAVPKDVKANDINPGDWVTINPAYAKAHGESALNGEYRIISKQVSAKDIFTNGDSIHEWGYDPAMK